MADSATAGGPIPCSVVNAYLAQKQRLLPGAMGTDLVSVTRDIVALHATLPTGPFLSLWARVRPGAAGRFQRERVEHALYDARELTRIPCMRNTVHVVPSCHVPGFLAAYGQRALPPEFRDWSSALVQAGLCRQGQADRILTQLTDRVVNAVEKHGPLTVREITSRVPELATRVLHSEGKSYEGTFSLGSRFVPFLCAIGALVRAQPLGTWRSNMYKYASMDDWLSPSLVAEIDLQEARVWLVKRYLYAFGPVTREDIAWWTGFLQSETDRALASLESHVVTVSIEGLDAECLMLAEDLLRLQAFAPPRTSYGFLLPGLDAYIMGYQDRRRFLGDEHRSKAFDRAGNAMPTVWANGRVVGAWTQRKDGTVVCGLFEEVDSSAKVALEERRVSLEEFFRGEYVPQRTQSPFTRRLEQWEGESSLTRQGS